jgi:hypothetical protein
VEQGAWSVRFGETPKTRREARVLPAVDWQYVFRRGRCCLVEAAVTLQKVGAYRDPRLYALNVFAEQFSHSVQPLVPNRLFINNAGGKDGEGQPGGGNVLETLLSLILSEKAGINISGDASTSRPLEDFIQKFTGNGGQSDRGQAKQETASIATAGKRDNSG